LLKSRDDLPGASFPSLSYRDLPKKKTTFKPDASHDGGLLGSGFIRAGFALIHQF
jgi:hypothetical protein